MGLTVEAPAGPRGPALVGLAPAYPSRPAGGERKVGRPAGPGRRAPRRRACAEGATLVEGTVERRRGGRPPCQRGRPSRRDGGAGGRRWSWPPMVRQRLGRRRPGRRPAPPVRPVKGQILTLRQTPATMSRRAGPRERVEHLPGAPRRRPGGRGRHRRGGGWDRRPPRGAQRAAQDALAMVPGLDDELVAGGRLRPGSPATCPWSVPRRRRLGGGTGHHRNGILLTPVTAEAVHWPGETVLPEVAPCDPRRFAPAGPGRERGSCGSRSTATSRRSPPGRPGDPGGPARPESAASRWPSTARW